MKKFGIMYVIYKDGDPRANLKRSGGPAGGMEFFYGTGKGNSPDKRWYGGFEIGA